MLSGMLSLVEGQPVLNRHQWLKAATAPALLRHATPPKRLRHPDVRHDEAAGVRGVPRAHGRGELQLEGDEDLGTGEEGRCGLRLRHPPARESDERRELVEAAGLWQDLDAVVSSMKTQIGAQPMVVAGPIEQKAQEAFRQTQGALQDKQRAEIYTYEAPWLIYGMNWSVRADQRFRLAVGSFEEEYSNSVRIIQLNEETHEFNEVAQFEHPYPATKMMWIPDANGARRDLLATTGDYLRIWNVVDNKSVRLDGLLNNNKNTEFCAPLTSFDWNETDPNIIEIGRAHV